MLADINFHGPSPSERGLGVRSILVKFSFSYPDNNETYDEILKNLFEKFTSLSAQSLPKSEE